MERYAEARMEAPEWSLKRAEALLALFPDEWEAAYAQPTIVCPHDEGDDSWRHTCIGEYIGPGWMVLRAGKVVRWVAAFEVMETAELRDGFFERARACLAEAVS
jgi:hypothetical protein